MSANFWYIFLPPHHLTHDIHTFNVGPQPSGMYTLSLYPHPLPPLLVR